MPRRRPCSVLTVQWNGTPVRFTLVEISDILYRLFDAKCQWIVNKMERGDIPVNHSSDTADS